MKINFTTQQYKDLIKAFICGSSITGLLSDVYDDDEYKEENKRFDDLQKHLLQYAHHFDCDDLCDEDRCVKDDFYDSIIMPLLEEYENHVMYDRLANKLAWRDFHENHSEEEIKKMSKENGGYFGVALYDYEKKYWDELDERGITRLKITPIIE